MNPLFSMVIFLSAGIALGSFGAQEKIYPKAYRDGFCAAVERYYLRDLGDNYPPYPVGYCPSNIPARIDLSLSQGIVAEVRK